MLSKFWFYLQQLFGGDTFSVDEVEQHIVRLKNKRDKCKADEFVYFTDEINYWKMVRDGLSNKRG